MSGAVFGKFLGQGWSVQKQPTWKTVVQQATSGKEVRISLWNVPLWEFTLTYEVINAAQKYAYSGMVPVASSIITANPYVANDYAAIAGFFMARGGSFDSWLFDDPNDHATAQDIIGQGDGTSSQFQAKRNLGEFSEPLQNLNGTPIVASLWQASTAVANGALILPSIVATRYMGTHIVTAWQTPGWPCYYSASGGTTGTVEPNWDNARVPGMTTVDGSVTWTNQGVGQVLYTEQTLPDWTSGSKTLGTAIKPTSGNAGNFTYLATTAGSTGARPGSFVQTMGGSTGDGGVTWTNYGVSLGGVNNPIVPRLPSTWSASSLGIIALSPPVPPAGAYVRLTTGFYFRCRFMEDRINFEEFGYKLYKLAKLSFTSIKL